LSEINVPIIFTGSMKPMDCVNSDAIQNITESIMACQIINPDIYISFHSTLFDVNNVQKNKEMLRFETLNNNFITTNAIN
jgi:L-asparaginase/Glu-tRNA(Gln) amidotransferase subunit D